MITYAVQEFTRAREFRDHVMTNGPGWSWRCANPKSSFYYYRVTWSLGVLLVSGDIGEMVVSHYSFNDPWNAAAWVNRADYDYLMSKTNIRQEYDEAATKAHIVSYAYDLFRSGSPRLMRAIVLEHAYSDDESDPNERKSACRHLRDDILLESDAWDLSPDHELPCRAYPASSRLQYDALKLWAHELWQREPYWHVAVRRWRDLRRQIANMRRYPLVWAPIRYVAVRRRDGEVYTLNGQRVWTWVGGKHPYYKAIVPARLLGLDLTRLGFWRVQGSTWSDDIRDPREFSFRDLRIGEKIR